MATAYRKHAKAIHVRFVYLPDLDDSMRARWDLMEKSKSSAESDLLRGFRRTLAVEGVRRSLASRCKPHGAAEVTAWFSSVHFESEKMTKDIVAQHLKIYDRIATNKKSSAMLDEMESRWGRFHGLSSLTALDLVCKKTSLPKNKPLESALITWVIHGIAVACARGHSEVPKASSVGTFSNILLLVRRVVFYLLNRFPPRTQSGKDMKDTLLKLFGDWLGFHKAFSKGEALEPMGLAPPEMETTVLGQLDDTSQSLAEFLTILMDLRSDVYVLLKTATAQSALVSPDAWLMREDVKAAGIFDLTDFGEKYNQPREQEPVPQEPSLPPPPAGPTPVTLDFSEELSNEAPASEGVSQATLRNELVKEHFPDVVLPSEVLDKFGRVDPETLTKMLDSACLRASPRCRRFAEQSLVVLQKGSRKLCCRRRMP